MKRGAETGPRPSYRDESLVKLRWQLAWIAGLAVAAAGSLCFLHVVTCDPNVTCVHIFDVCVWVGVNGSLIPKLCFTLGNSGLFSSSGTVRKV